MLLCLISLLCDARGFGRAIGEVREFTFPPELPSVPQKFKQLDCGCVYILFVFAACWMRAAAEEATLKGVSPGCLCPVPLPVVWQVFDKLL